MESPFPELPLGHAHGGRFPDGIFRQSDDGGGPCLRGLRLGYSYGHWAYVDANCLPSSQSRCVKRRSAAAEGV
jgi:hypothetical protein